MEVEMSEISDKPRSAPRSSSQPNGPKPNRNWMEVDFRRGKITTVGDPATKTLFAIVAVVVSYLFFTAISVWGVVKFLLL
jgi:hypothetical protein